MGVCDDQQGEGEGGGGGEEGQQQGGHVGAEQGGAAPHSGDLIRFDFIRLELLLAHFSPGH